MTVPTGQYTGDIADRLCAIFDTVTGIKRTFPTTPRQLRDPDLPSIVVRPINATYTRNASNRMDELRQWEIYLFLAKITQGTEGEKQQTLYDTNLIDLVSQMIFARPQLQLNDDGLVINVVLNNDDGVQTITFGTDEYIAVLFRVTIQRNLIVQRIP